MEISKNALTVLEKRYLIKDQDGNPTETVEEMFDRVATAIAEQDKNYDKSADTKAIRDEFYELMTSLSFLPNSPTLMNAGRPLGQLSACFVLPVSDSMSDIFEAIKQAALIHKSGGGTGFSFSRLRPAGSPVNSTGGVASGPISFMKVFNMATEAVKQGGTRRGANMGILRVDHPDILEFIDCKKDGSEITNFNISVGITEKFMLAVEHDADYSLIDPSSNQAVGTLKAREVFNKIVEAAWRNGEPGIIFIDRLNRDNVVPSQGEIESTNPCGEQPLLPYESCNLGSINLTRMAKEENGKYIIDTEKLKKTVHTAIHFLDNVIDANRYPLPIIDKVTKQTRKVGLGVMGWADLLLMLEVPYNSDEAIALAEELMSFINKESHAASIELAKLRGPFPLFKDSIYANKEPIRNATVTTIAPTGTLSIIAGCSSGIEPVFAYAYVRNVMDGTELIEANPILQKALEKAGLFSEELMRRISKEGSITHIEEIPAYIRHIFVSAHDITPLYHIRMQSAFQKYTDNAVSKTVNFSSDATVDDVREVYMQAYKSGCKGVTIYRDGSRTGQVLNIGSVNKDEKTISPEDAPGCQDCSIIQNRGFTPRPRPDVTTGFTEKVKIGCGNLYITVNYDENGICEVFTNTGRAGGCPSQSEATSRLVSIALRSGMDVNSIIEQLKGIRCHSTIRQPGMKVTSCPDAIAKALAKVYKLQNGESASTTVKTIEAVKTIEIKEPETTYVPGQKRFCPECGTPVAHEGGCVICKNCGYSKCG